MRTSFLRLRAKALALSALAVVAVPWLGRPTVLHAEPASEPAPASEAASEDALGEIVVEASEDEAKRIRLPPLLVRPSVGTRPEVLALHAVVARDLELAGMHEVDASLSELSPDDPRLRVTVDVQVDGEHPPRMVARIEPMRGGVGSGREVVVEGAALRDRAASHRLADRVLGELTGRNGAFAGRLAVVRRAEGDPRLYHADPDGRGLKVITPPSQLVIATAFDSRGRLHYTASSGGGAARLFRVDPSDPVPKPILVQPTGAIYGVGFGADGRMALSIAQGPRIEVWTGKDPAALTRAREGALDLHPVLGPGGRLAFAGETRGVMRIFIDLEPVSPRWGRASAPTWCDHPDGPRLLWVERSSRSAWIWSLRPGAGPAQKLLGVRGTIAAPACSPDGRLLVFSYDDGRALEGPGIYVGNIDVLRPKKIMPGSARALAWAPEPAAAPKPAPKPKPAPMPGSAQ